MIDAIELGIYRLGGLFGILVIIAFIMTCINAGKTGVQCDENDGYVAVTYYGEDKEPVFKFDLPDGSGVFGLYYNDHGGYFVDMVVTAEDGSKSVHKIEIFPFGEEARFLDLKNDIRRARINHTPVDAGEMYVTFEMSICRYSRGEDVLILDVPTINAPEANACRCYADGDKFYIDMVIQDGDGEKKILSTPVMIFNQEDIELFRQS